MLRRVPAEASSADLTAVHTGKATIEYGDAKAFYERTYITEGMSKLLIQVARRLNGKGRAGDPAPDRVR